MRFRNQIIVKRSLKLREKKRERERERMVTVISECAKRESLTLLTIFIIIYDNYN